MSSIRDSGEAVNRGLTLRERAHELDEDETAMLANVLLNHPTFRAKIDCLAAIEDPAERTNVAEQKAKSYTANNGPQRREIVRLMLLAADHLPSWRSTIAANDHRTAVWADDQRTSELRRQRVRGRGEKLLDGARRVARYGAGECTECGAPLLNLYEQIVSSKRRRRTRRLYCSQHEAYAKHWAGVHKQRMRSALEAATGQHRHRLNRRHGTPLS